MKNKINNKFLCLILAVILLLSSVATGIIANAKVNLKNDLFLKRSDVYYFKYNDKTKKNVEKLMDKVDELDDKKICTKEKVNDLWEEFKEIIKTVPRKEMVGFYPDRISFEQAKYKGKYKEEDLSGYDQFAYVYQNLLYYACQYLTDKEMNEFISTYVDDFYSLCVWQHNKKNTNIELYRIFTLLNNVADEFDDRNKLIINRATNMVSALIQSIYNNEKWTEKQLPSQLIDKELQEVKETEERVKQEGQEQIENEENLELRKPTISSGSTTGSSDTSYSDSYDDYYNNLRNEYDGVSENEGGDNGLYNIYYTVNKNDEKPEYIDSKIQIKKDKITYTNICDALKIFASKEGFDWYDDSDAFMFIAEGKPIVLNDIGENTVKNDRVNHLLDDFPNVGLKVALEASEDGSDLANSLASKIENNEINEVDINGTKLILTNPPVLKDNIVQLPIKQILSELELDFVESGNEYVISKVEDKNDTDTKTDEEEPDKHEFKFKVGDKKYTIDNRDGMFKTEPQIKNEILYVEMDSITKAFGYEFSYNAEKSCFVIK